MFMTAYILFPYGIENSIAYDYGALMVVDGYYNLLIENKKCTIWLS